MCIARTVTYDCNHKKIIETSCEYWSLPVAGALRACKTSTSTEHVRQVCSVCAVRGLETDSESESEATESTSRDWDVRGSSRTFLSLSAAARAGRKAVGSRGRRLRLSAQTFPFLSQREWKRKWHPPANWEIGMVRQVVVQHDPVAAAYAQAAGRLPRDAWIVPGSQPAPTTYLKVPETAPHVRNKALNLLDKARAPSPLRRLLMPPWERRHVLRSALDADELFFETVEAAPKISVSRGPTAPAAAAAPPDGAKKETAPVDAMGQAAKKSAFRTMSMKHKVEKEQGHQPHSTKPPIIRVQRADSADGATIPVPQSLAIGPSVSVRKVRFHEIPRKPVRREPPTQPQSVLRSPSQARAQAPPPQTPLASPPPHVPLQHPQSPPANKGALVEHLRPLRVESLTRRKGRTDLRADAAKDEYSFKRAVSGVTAAVGRKPRYEPEGSSYQALRDSGFFVTIPYPTPEPRMRYPELPHH